MSSIDQLKDCIEITALIECDSCGEQGGLDDWIISTYGAAKQFALLGWTTDDEGYAKCPTCSSVLTNEQKRGPLICLSVSR